MTEVLLDIDLARKRRGIEAALRAAIRTGRLRPGDALASSRTFASELGVARATVVGAYEQLAAEGYLVARPGGRTCVANGSWSASAPSQAVPQTPAWRLDLVPGEGDRSAFPRAAWARCTRQVLTAGGTTCSATANRSGWPRFERSWRLTWLGRAVSKPALSAS